MKPNTQIKIQTEEKQKQRAADTCSHCEPEVSVVTDETPSHSTPMAQPEWKEHWNLLLALLILAVMMVLNLGFNIIPEKIIDFSIHAVAYILAGYNVIRLAIRRIQRADFFNEFVLMTVATLGAFYIGSYSEGVAVMVFYCIGEWFQDAAVSKARRNIKALLDIRPNEVTVIQNGIHQTKHPSAVEPGDIILVRNGERVALDGELISGDTSFDAAALTGESVPVLKHTNEKIYAGMISLNKVAEIKVNAAFKDSALSRILQMVQDATARKSRTQLFISRFAKVYTPIVFFLALALCVIPYFIVDNYIFNDWFYRALVFLVISCPCALVVSIPLGYFGGIGLASRNGILFKGGNFLDALTKTDTVVMDKTGTLTHGVFKVQKVVAISTSEKELVSLTAALERHSTHPAGKAIVDFASSPGHAITVTGVEEFAGRGLTGIVNGKKIAAGNTGLFQHLNISFPQTLNEEAGTIILVAIDDAYAGYFLIADAIKDDAFATIKKMQALNIDTIMLSGDKQSVVDKVAQQLGIQKAFGDLLPGDKLAKVQQLKDAGKRIVFAGDGINDAPVIALADVGIAMGALGSHAAIETADVVIQNDQPSKILTAIKIGRITRNIVWQNIILAMGVKIAVLVLAAEGSAELWEAVIADVGVALLAILNAVRIQRFRFN